MNSFLPNKTLFFYYPQIMGQNHFPRPKLECIFRDQNSESKYDFRSFVSAKFCRSIFLHLHGLLRLVILSFFIFMTSVCHSIFLYLHDLLLLVILSFFTFMTYFYLLFCLSFGLLNLNVN